MSAVANNDKLADTTRVIRWLEVGHLNNIPARGARRIIVDNEPIAVFRTATNEVFAIEDKCPHAGGPLSQGIVHDDCVTCPLHSWDISLRTGKAQGADEGKTRSYPVKIDDERVQVGIVGIAQDELVDA